MYSQVERECLVCLDVYQGQSHECLSFLYTLIVVQTPVHIHMMFFLPATVPLMAGRLLKVSSVATAVCLSSSLYFYQRQLDLNDLSIIRFGRAAATVSYCTVVT